MFIYSLLGDSPGLGEKVASARGSASRSEAPPETQVNISIMRMSNFDGYIFLIRSIGSCLKLQHVFLDGKLTLKTENINPELLIVSLSSLPVLTQ